VLRLCLLQGVAVLALERISRRLHLVAVLSLERVSRNLKEC
jgi:hypothetical protein